jgi:hypothetical protein
MGLIHQQLVYADTVIGAVIIQTISAQGRVLVTSLQTISCDTKIKEPIILYAVANVSKPEESEIIGESDLLNPIPSTPISLVAADAGLGDAINLNWISTASYFNVYIKNGAILTKVNPTILENTTSYMAGNLTPDVTVTFVVKAANALGQESTISNEANAIPTFKDLENRFSSPTYEVKVAGNVLDDAILSEVSLGYGSNYSMASFSLPRDPLIPSSPDLGDTVEIKINDRLVFKGYITVRSDGISNGGLSIIYECNSTLMDMTRVTLTESPLVGGTAKFNLFEIGSDGIGRMFYRANADVILRRFGVDGAPNVYPGYVDVTDSTPLAAAELVLSRIGNYKIYHDMNTGKNYAYAFGSHGFKTRKFFVGKNIVDYNIRKSDMDIVKTVEVMGAPTVVRKRAKVSLQIGQDPDGKISAYFNISGTNIRDIQPYGHVREKPTITFNDLIQVSILDFEDTFSDEVRELRRKETLSSEDSFNLKYIYGINSDLTDPQYALRPAIEKIVNYMNEWQSIGAKVVYNGDDNARVYLQEVPKLWKANTKSGYVKASTIAANVSPEGIVQDPDALNYVEVLLDYDYAIGSVEVEYTYDGDAPYVRVGSGLPSKSITDGQYQPVVDNINHIDTTALVYAEMIARANGELAQLSRDVVGGTITIIGDETMDLRSSVDASGTVLEVSGIRHSFENGFLTTINLTNEPFIMTPVFAPIVTIGSSDKQNEKNKKAFTQTFDLRKLVALVKDLQSQKEQRKDAENNAPKTGPFTTLL